MPVRAVTFDADDTLWDFSSVSPRASAAVLERVREMVPDFEGTLDDLIRCRAEVGDEAEPGTPFPLIRRRAIERFVAQLDADESVIDDLHTRYFTYLRDNRVLFDEVPAMLDALDPSIVIGVITNGNTEWGSTTIADRIDFWLAADQVGVRKPDRRIIDMAAAAAGCRVRELVHVGDEPHSDVAAAAAAGARAVWIDRHGRRAPGDVAIQHRIESLAELPGLIAAWDRAEVEGVGVGPHPRPWPEGDWFDAALLEHGDRRNVVDRYRYWRREAIKADLDRTRYPFHVAIENWRHDLNIGTIVRTANAFGAAAVHIVGERRWNRRGAMVTDRYQHIHHHPTMADLIQFARTHELSLVGIDNVPGAEPLESAQFDRGCLLLFGQEGTGLSVEAREALDRVLSIRQVGSTRSINAGVAAGIAMHAWLRQHG